MDFSKTFEKYEALVSEVDKIFKSVQDAYSDFVCCETRCADCCHAVFDITLIEAVYLNHQFTKLLPRKVRRPIGARAEKADRKYYQIKRKLQKMYVDDEKSPEDILAQLALERVRCPLLNDDDLCDLYDKRPITCRVYGIPTAIGGKARICEKSKFEDKAAYPTVNLDKMNDRLFALSRELLRDVGSKHPKRYMSLVPPSAALMMTYDEEYFGIKQPENDDAPIIP